MSDEVGWVGGVGGKGGKGLKKEAGEVITSIISTANRLKKHP